jgi:hypothetical protein
MSDIENCLAYLHDPQAVFELCIIRPKKPTSNLWTRRANGKKTTISGWFVDPETAAKFAGQIEAEGIYTTLNPCKPAIHARAQNRLEAAIDRTADKDIDRIANLLIDVDADPGGVSGVSSTDADHRAALEMAEIIQADLSKGGWPEPMQGDSGNGAHLIYPVDLPNTPENVTLIKEVLLALALRYKDPLARLNLGIDTAVFNPSRLTKLFGPMVRKGDDTKTRPHRLAKILSNPEKRRPVPWELLQELADTLPPDTGQSKGKESSADGRVDVRAYLTHYGKEVVKEKPWQGGTLFGLAHCVFDESHQDNEAAIGQWADGGLYYQCFHATCKAARRTWTEARELISGADKLTPFMVGGTRDRSRGRIIESATSSDQEIYGELEQAIREGTLTPDQKAYLIELVEKTAPKKNIAEEVREWVLTSNGLFLTSECFRELGLTSRDFQKAAPLELLKLKNKGVIEPCGERRGCYRLVEKEAEEIPWKTCGIPEPLDFRQPLDLHELVYFYPGNIVVVGGTYNAGKTVYCLNTAALNMNHWKVNYLSSEMTPEELADRLYKFEKAGLVKDIDAWDKVRFRKRRNNFHQVIDPDGLNIVDYLEMTKEFYAIGGLIDQIFQKLNKGIAVIAIQKAPGETHARGGAFTVEKARFAVSIDFEELKIIKAKNVRSGIQNPTNNVIKFHVANGTKMIRTG